MRLTDLFPRKLYRGFEGGAVYTAEKEGRLFVVIDEGTLRSVLPPEELEDIRLQRVLEFDTESERTQYLEERFAKVAPASLTVPLSKR